jgi:hypothetical protein
MDELLQEVARRKGIAEKLQRDFVANIPKWQKGVIRATGYIFVLAWILVIASALSPSILVSFPESRVLLAPFAQEGSLFVIPFCVGVVALFCKKLFNERIYQTFSKKYPEEYKILQS